MYLILFLITYTSQHVYEVARNFVAIRGKCYMFTVRKQQVWGQGVECEGSSGQYKDSSSIAIHLHGLGFFAEEQCSSEPPSDSLHLQDTSDQLQWWTWGHKQPEKEPPVLVPDEEIVKCIAGALYKRKQFIEHGVKELYM